MWNSLTSSAEMVPYAIITSKFSMRLQKSEPNSTIGTPLALWVCTRVSTSNSSSMVPKPPGKTTSALARIIRCILRSAK
ncbi:hypothetical protein D3C71_1546120 [compost metagenome]